MDELHGTMEIALIFAALAIVIAYAKFEAWWDNERIEAGERIDHIEGWIVRAIIVGFLWTVASFKIGLDAIPCAIGSAFLFSAVFRYCLNRMRGKDWRYVAPWSAIYDCFWMMISIHITSFRVTDVRRMWPTKAHLDGFRAFYVAESGVMTNAVHRAGTIAYAFEVLILAVCIYIAAT
jgi:hypothetical protein